MSSSPQQQHVYRQAGGRPYLPRTRPGFRVLTSHDAVSAGGEVWDYGWVPFEDRDAEGERLHAEAVAEMPAFSITGRRLL